MLSTDFGRSFAGGCFGPLDSTAWIIGLEPGGDAPNIEEIDSAPSAPPRYAWSDHLQYQYWRRTLWLFQGVHDTEAPPEPCKLNLYPVPSKKLTSWKPEIYGPATGFGSKAMYQAWCHHVRFPWISELVARHKPRVLIGTGTAHVPAFATALLGHPGVQWGPSGASTFSVVHEENGKSKVVEIHQISATLPDGNRTDLFVVPFLNYYKGCLNSEGLARRVGDEVGRRSMRGRADKHLVAD